MLNRKLLPIFLIVVVDVLGLTIVIPLLPFYAEKFGASPFVAGLVVTTYAVCQLLSGPLLGQLSDRIGRRPVLLVSQVGTLIGFLILGLANSLWMVFLGRFIDGVTAGNLSVAQAVISDQTEPHERAKSFALIGIAFGLGFLVGPAISGFLSQFGYHFPFFAAAGLSALSILATYFLLPRERGTQMVSGPSKLGIFQWGQYTKYFADARMAGLLAQFFLFAVSFGLFLSGFALFAERRFVTGTMPYGPKEVGYIFAYAGFLGLFIQGGFLGRIVAKVGEKRLIVISFSLASAGYALLAFSYERVSLFLAITIFTCGHALLRPSLTSLISQQADRSEQGIVLGLTQALNSFAQIVAPVLGGFLIQFHWLSAWSLSAGAATALGGILAIRHNPRLAHGR